MSSHLHCCCAHNPSSAAATLLVREENANGIALKSTTDIALILLLLLWSAEDARATDAVSSSQETRNLPLPGLYVRWYALCVTQSLATGMMLEKTSVDTAHQLLTVGLLL